MKPPSLAPRRVRVAIAGLGTVGCGLVKLLQQRAEQAEIVAVSAKSQTKPRSVSVEGYAWYDDAESMAGSVEADVIVELIGGSEGVALRIAHKALERGLSLVTANKSLLACHGEELGTLAEESGASIGWEAAVAGAVPIVASIRQSLLANRAQRLCGILNGTCNYILTRLQQGQESLAQAVRDAQDKGFAEADPTFDIEGIDSAHKIALLSALAFATKPDLDSVNVEGIRDIEARDITLADRLGYCIKLLALAELIDGKISQCVYPMLVRKDSLFASVDGVQNAALYKGDFCETIFMSGHGAGAETTASAVAGDIFAIGRGRKIPLFGLPMALLSRVRRFPSSQLKFPWYLHFRVRDQVGVVAEIASVLRDNDISLASILQDETRENAAAEKTAAEKAAAEKAAAVVSLLLITHNARTNSMQAALERIVESGILRAPPKAIRIYDEQAASIGSTPSPSPSHAETEPSLHHSRGQG